MIDSTPDTRPSPSAGAKPIVVLLVDDQAFVGNAVGMLLASETDIELHSCLYAVNAVALANQIAPSLILQDLVMPEIDGLTLVRLFQTNPLTARTPVIVLSGNDDLATRARALAAGATGYLIKLPPKAELVACIRRHAVRGAKSGDTLDHAVIETFREAGAPLFLRHLIDQFIQEAGGRIRMLKEAAHGADAQAVYAVAHNLKGSSMIMGASRLAALCSQVEDHVAATPEVPVSPSLVLEIEEELVRVQYALTAEREDTHQ